MFIQFWQKRIVYFTKHSYKLQWREKHNPQQPRWILSFRFQIYMSRNQFVLPELFHFVRNAYVFLILSYFGITWWMKTNKWRTHLAVQGVWKKSSVWAKKKTIHCKCFSNKPYWMSYRRLQLNLFIYLFYFDRWWNFYENRIKRPVGVCLKVIDFFLISVDSETPKEW